jgi:hypothetical protein
MDVRDAADCPAVDAYRQSLIDGTSSAAPEPLDNCPPRFGTEATKHPSSTPKL